MVLLVYGSNDYRLKVREKVDGIVCQQASSSETTTCNKPIF